jgi:hypothetical protein
MNMVTIIRHERRAMFVSWAFNSKPSGSRRQMVAKSPPTDLPTPRRNDSGDLAGGPVFRRKSRISSLHNTAASALRCLEKMDEAALQIDHRVPYEVAGEGEELKTDDFMLLCGSANRAKSWSCEHCENWKSTKDKNICLSCYWAFPEKYNHVAMRQIRRVDLVWQGEEVAQYDKLKADSAKSGLEIPQFVKEVLAKVLK